MILRLLAFTLPLGLDTFAVSTAMGITGMSRREKIRLVLVLTAFEGGVPLVGLFLGGVLGSVVGRAGEFLGGGILLAFGLFTLVRRDEEEDAEKMAKARGRALLALGLSVSLDEVAMGFTLGVLGLAILPVLGLIVGQTIVLSSLGLALGRRVAERFRALAERLAGVALLGLGVYLLLEALHVVG